MRGFFYAGDKVSEGLNNLRAALNLEGHRMLRLRAEGSQFTPSREKLIINWGTTSAESTRLAGGISQVLNKPGNVLLASNKREAFDAFVTDGVQTPTHCTTVARAIELLRAARCRIYARTVVNGSSGDGIILMLRSDDPAVANNANFGAVPVVIFGEDMAIRDVLNGQRERLIDRIRNCQLFTLGRIGKRVEYRVHVFNDEIIHQSIKLRRNREDENEEHRNHLVRNLDNGWIYGNVAAGDVPPRVFVEAKKAVSSLDLDFGAVDLLYYPATRDIGASALVLEVNTAPGLAPESSALKAYCDAIIKYTQG